MILLRGIKGKEFAKKADEGLVGLRDLLSTLLNTDYTGYNFSGYYERFFVEAFEESMQPPINYEDFRADISKKMLLTLNRIIPYLYIVYFHILSSDSEQWLNEFSDDMDFIYLIPKEYELSGIYDENLVGQELRYIKEKNEMDILEFKKRTTGMLSIIQTHVLNAGSTGAAFRFAESICRMMMPLFYRITDSRFSEKEKEFRIIYKAPTPLDPITNEFCPLEEREFVIDLKKDGIIHQYKGKMLVKRDKYNIKHCSMPLHGIPMVSTELTRELQNDNVDFTVESEFLDIDFRYVADEVGYIGGKEKCREFIRKNL